MKIRAQTFLVLIVLGVGLLAAAIASLFVYMSVTATPLHPDAQKISSVTRSSPSPEWTEAVEQGRQIVRAGLTGQNLPAISVAVGVGGTLVWAEGFGWADLDHHTPATPETRFRTGEVSKALTSAAAGLLVERNALRLDADIQTYVPEFPRKQWPITVRQLMGHVAGLRDDPGDEAWMEPCERTLDGLKLFASDALLFEPGTQYRASSYSWILVSAAIEAAARDSFFAVMRREIFAPLQMSDTVPDSATHSIPNRATFYFPRFAGDNKYGPEAVREGDHSCYAGASAFLSTPSDLVRFGMAIVRIRQGSGAQGGTLLQRATVDMLQTPQVLRSGEETGYGLGWKLETIPLAGAPTRMAGHGTKADFIGGTTYLMTFPERGLVVAAMSNTSFADMKSVATSLAGVFAELAKAPR